MIQGFKYNANKPNGNNERTSISEWLIFFLIFGLFATTLIIVMLGVVYTIKLF